jgi:hypothetical protein
MSLKPVPTREFVDFDELTSKLSEFSVEEEPIVPAVYEGPQDLGFDVPVDDDGLPVDMILITNQRPTLPSVIQRKACLRKRLLLDKQPSKFDFNAQQNLNIGRLIHRKQGDGRNLTIPEQCVHVDLFNYLRMNKFSRYANRQETLDHMEKLGRKFWKEEAGVEFTSMSAQDVNLHFATVQKATDERANTFLLAPEHQELSRSRRLVKAISWVNRKLGFCRPNKSLN